MQQTSPVFASYIDKYKECSVWSPLVRDRGWVSEEVQIGFLGAGWGSGKYPVGRLEDLIERDGEGEDAPGGENAAGRLFVLVSGQSCPVPRPWHAFD